MQFVAVPGYFQRLAWACTGQSMKRFWLARMYQNGIEFQNETCVGS